MMRIGEIKLSRFFIESKTAVKVFRILEFIPTNIEFRHEWGGYMYTGLSPCFDEVEKGCVINEYEIIITQKNEADFSIDLINLTKNKDI